MPPTVEPRGRLSDREHVPSHRLYLREPLFETPFDGFASVSQLVREGGEACGCVDPAFAGSASWSSSCGEASKFVFGASGSVFADEFGHLDQVVGFLLEESLGEFHWVAHWIRAAMRAPRISARVIIAAAIIDQRARERSTSSAWSVCLNFSVLRVDDSGEACTDPGSPARACPELGGE